MQLYCRPSATYLHIRVWCNPLEGNSSQEVLNIVLYKRSPFKKRGRSIWLKARKDPTTSLCLARINVSEPSLSVMHVDGIMKAVKKLLFTKSMEEYKNKLRNCRSLQSSIISDE